MCGIAGIIRFDDRPIDRRRAEAVLAHLRHRGPDGEGISGHDRCTLIHTRLAIIDALGGEQPMHAPKHDSQGALHLVFNGEVYNHRALRKKLEKRGYTFRSDHSDTEALLLGYRAYGEQLPKHLRGMFAFAIWDEQKRELYMARDRTGKKPLYFRKAEDELTFASLPATLAADPENRPRVSDQALVKFLRFGYPFGYSMLQDTFEVPPAHWIKVDATGRIDLRRYWRPPPISRTSTSLGAVDSVEQVLAEAVAVRLEADVPLGCFLSGGIDSSIVAALAQQQLREWGSPALKTYNVSMPDAEYDESPHARMIAKHLGTDHTELMADPSDLIGDLKLLMAVTGEPTADSGVLPGHWVCKAARPHIKAALTGDGGDELFGGYDRYRALGMIARHRWWMRAMPRSLIRYSSHRSTASKVRRLLDAASAGDKPWQQYFSMIHLFTDRQVRELAPDLADRLSPQPIDDWPDEPDIAHAAMRWDLIHYLPQNLLRKADRSSMAIALELRCPLLDTQVVDLAGHLPTSVLMPHGQPKGLLRRLASRHLPESVTGLPKRGFGVPIGRWFREQHADSLRDYLTSPGLDALGLEQRVVRRLLDEHQRSRFDHSHRLFALLQLALWCDWLKNPSVPPVFAG